MQLLNESLSRKRAIVQPNISNIIININVLEKQERYNEDATNAITKIVLERTYYFNNICYGTIQRVSLRGVNFTI